MTPQSLDEDFGRFLALFGSPVHAQPMPEAAFDACAGLLPRQLFTYWREVGVCGFGDGLMWMTNPQEFESLLARWLQGTLLRQRRDLAVIARTAFGELLVWASGKGQVALISPLEGIVFHYASADRAPAQAPGAEADAQMRRFWGGLRPETFEQEDDAQRPCSPAWRTGLAPCRRRRCMASGSTPAWAARAALPTWPACRCWPSTIWPWSAARRALWRCEAGKPARGRGQAGAGRLEC